MGPLAGARVPPAIAYIATLAIRRAGPLQSRRGRVTKPESKKTRGMCIATRCTSVEQFIQMFHRFVDEESFFVSTLNTRPPGLETPFSVQLADGTPVLRGLCTVLQAWTDAANPFKTPGVRLGIKRLTANSMVVFEQLLVTRSAGKPPPSLSLSVSKTPLAAPTLRGPALGALPRLPAVVPPIPRAVPTAKSPYIETAPTKLAPSRVVLEQPARPAVARPALPVSPASPVPTAPPSDATAEAVPTAIAQEPTDIIEEKTDVREVNLPRAASPPIDGTRTPGSDLVLPANPLMNLSDESLEGYVDCTLYEETGNFFPADEDLDDEPDEVAPAPAPAARPPSTGFEANPDTELAARRFETASNPVAYAAAESVPRTAARSVPAARPPGPGAAASVPSTPAGAPTAPPLAATAPTAPPLAATASATPPVAAAAAPVAPPLAAAVPVSHNGHGAVAVPPALPRESHATDPDLLARGSTPIVGDDTSRAPASLAPAAGAFAVGPINGAHAAEPRDPLAIGTPALASSSARERLVLAWRSLRARIAPLLARPRVWLVGGAAALALILIVVIAASSGDDRAAAPAPAPPTSETPLARTAAPLQHREPPAVKPPPAVAAATTTAGADGDETAQDQAATDEAAPEEPATPDSSAAEGGPPLVGSGPCRLVVATTPAGSIIKLDGDKLGPSPLTIAASCERHKLDISHPRYQPSSRFVAFAEGTHDDL